MFSDRGSIEKSKILKLLKNLPFEISEIYSQEELKLPVDGDSFSHEDMFAGNSLADVRESDQRLLEQNGYNYDLAKRGLLYLGLCLKYKHEVLDPKQRKPIAERLFKEKTKINFRLPFDPNSDNYPGGNNRDKKIGIYLTMNEIKKSLF